MTGNTRRLVSLAVLRLPNTRTCSQPIPAFRPLTIILLFIYQNGEIHEPFEAPLEL